MTPDELKALETPPARWTDELGEDARAAGRLALSKLSDDLRLDIIATLTAAGAKAAHITDIDVSWAWNELQRRDRERWDAIDDAEKAWRERRSAEKAARAAERILENGRPEN